MTEEENQELEYLRWFRSNADFGPADGDVKQYLNERYTKEKGKSVPEAWRSER